MSMRIIASALSNRNSASDLHSSVLPTPVGPRNRNEPPGRFGSDRPARERRTASETTLIASSWPTTRLCSTSSMRSSLSRSPSSILLTGMPVQRDTTSAISSSVTLSCTSLKSLASSSCAAANCFSSCGSRPYWISLMRAKSWRRCAASRSSLACSTCSLIFVAPCSAAFSDFQISLRSENSRSRPSMSFSRSAKRCREASSFSFFSISRWIFSWITRRSRRSSSSGLESISMRRREAASSIRSMALSGSWRSVI